MRKFVTETITDRELDNEMNLQGYDLKLEIARGHALGNCLIEYFSESVFREPEGEEMLVQGSHLMLRAIYVLTLPASDVGAFRYVHSVLNEKIALLNVWARQLDAKLTESVVAAKELLRYDDPRAKWEAERKATPSTTPPPLSLMEITTIAVSLNDAQELLQGSLKGVKDNQEIQRMVQSGLQMRADSIHQNDLADSFLLHRALLEAVESDQGVNMLDGDTRVIREFHHAASVIQTLLSNKPYELFQHLEIIRSLCGNGGNQYSDVRARMMGKCSMEKIQAATQKAGQTMALTYLKPYID